MKMKALAVYLYTFVITLLLLVWYLFCLLLKGKQLIFMVSLFCVFRLSTARWRAARGPAEPDRS